MKECSVNTEQIVQGGTVHYCGDLTHTKDLGKIRRNIIQNMKSETLIYVCFVYFQW